MKKIVTTGNERTCIQIFENNFIVASLSILLLFFSILCKLNYECGEHSATFIEASVSVALVWIEYP